MAEGVVLRTRTLVLLLCLITAGGCDGGPREATTATAGPAGGAASAAPAATLVERSLASLQAALLAGEETCVDVVRGYRARIAAYDAPRGLGAISFLNPAAEAEAAALDARIAAGAELGPLFCAPLLVKDNIDVAGLPTTAGSAVLAESLPPDDAFVIERLRAADAIVLAKTNMGEWAFSPRQTVSSSQGVTANAYALDHVPAGSSGGTASGVAASFAVAGLGTDTGNSIRGPSSHLALFGIRVTLGLTSRDGIVPLLFDRDVVGPMTRSVEDGARLLDVMAGTDPADPYTAEASARREDSYRARLRPDGLVGARIGVLRALADPEDGDAEILDLFEAALEDLEAAGATLVDPFEVPALAMHLAADNFCNRFRYDLSVYLDGLGEGAPFRDARTLLDPPRHAPQSTEALRRFTEGPLEGPPGSWSPPCPDFADHPGRQAFLAAVTAAMDAAAVDAVAYPTWTFPPATLARAVEDYRGDNSQRLAPTTGMPAITVPMGYSRQLPAGLQLLGRRWDDGPLLQYAYAFEQATMHRVAPAAFPALAPAAP